MDISTLAPSDAGRLLPLLHQVHALHVDALPVMYPALDDDDAVVQFLTGWLSQDAVTALIAGPKDTPKGYLIYVIETRAASVMRKGETVGMVHHISVDAACRRKGIAKALFAEARARLAAQCVTTLATTYAAFNTASAALMASEGLVPTTIYARTQ